MPLTVEAYDQAESEAQSRLSNRVIEAAKSGTFALLGYPMTVSSDEALWRYVDVMHELGEEEAYRNALGGLTEAEFDLFKQVSEVVAPFTEARFGHRIIPKGALVRAFIAYRHIRFISAPEETTVFEIGPGSGYLGALLALAGYRYAATDITQAFYLVQSNLWEHLFASRLIELATAPQDLKDFEELAPGTVLHVPWWKYYVADPGEIRLRLDVATANHTLCEMQPTALKYALRLSLACLGGPGRLKYFFIDGPGADDLRNRQQMCEEFEAAHYVPVFQEVPIDVFAPAGHGDALYKQPLPVESAPPNESAAPPQPPATGSRWLSLLNPAEVLRFAGRSVQILSAPGGAATFRNKVKAYLFRMPPQDRPEVAGPEAVEPGPPPPRSRVESRIRAGRDALAKEDRISFEEMREFQGRLADGADIRTEDEKFLRFAYGRDQW